MNTFISWRGLGNFTLNRPEVANGFHIPCVRGDRSSDWQKKTSRAFHSINANGKGLQLGEIGRDEAVDEDDISIITKIAELVTDFFYKSATAKPVLMGSWRC